MSRLSIIISIIAGLVVILFVVSGTASFFFNRNVEREVVQLFNTVRTADDVVTQEELAGLPDNVQQWLEYTGIVGKERIRAARLQQRADMRLAVDQPWMPVEATQYFTVDEPGFIWQATVKAAPGIKIAARDKYASGRGSMLIKPLSLITLADSQGSEMDQGAMLRYLAETIWFPSAALSDYISWEEIDHYNAKATMSYGGVTASGIFTFNDVGEVIRFEAERYGEFGGEFRLETWSIPLRDYREFAGIRIPTKGDVTWKFSSGDYNWFNFEVLDVEYNQPRPY